MALQSWVTGILLFDDVELLDFAGPIEVLTTANTLAQREGKLSPFSLLTVAQMTGICRVRGGLRVLPDHDFASCPRLDLLIVPGGPGARTEVENEQLIQWLFARSQQVDRLASVCTGALLLAKAGLLEGHRATTHWAAFEELASIDPHVEILRDARVVESGWVLTSAGVSAGIDLALKMVALYGSPDLARATARRIEYPLL